MPNSFEGKTPYEIAIDMCALVTRHRTEEQFKALSAMDAETRDFVVNKLEKKFLELADKFVAMIEEEGVTKAKKHFTGLHAPDAEDAVNEEQALTAVVQRIAALKGDAASPLVKNFAEELSKLTKEQAETENSVYGALFDALDKTMRADGTMAKIDEGLHLVRIDNAFNWRVSLSVKEHFNKAGKIQEFVAAVTDADKAEQKAAIKGLLWKTESEAALGSLTAMDVFLRAARRVSSDEELAALLPADKLDAEDVAVLEKNNLTSMAALVKKAIENKPK